jgi:hypothetical protein
MTAANVAVSPKVGRAWGHGPFMAVALSVGLMAGIAIGALALRPATATGPAAAPVTVSQTTSHPTGPMARGAALAPTTNLLKDYVQVVANIKAAESRHDFAAKSRFESQLADALTPRTIGVIYQEHARWLKALEQAQATGNGYEIFRTTEALNALCGTDAVKAQLSFCE